MSSKRMRGFESYLKFEDALKVVLSEVRPLGWEWVPFHNACGRILSESVVSKIDFPPFDRAAVDGYAVRASDTFGASERNPKRLRLVRAIGKGLRKGEASEVMTGKPMPKGADAVVMVEHTERRSDLIYVFQAVTPGKNVSCRGEDIRAGEVALPPGKKLGPQDVGMLACVGKRHVKVHRRPIVSIISTGSELRSPGAPLREGEVYDINTYSLSCAVRFCGGVPRSLGICGDDPSSLRRKLKEGLEGDLIIVSGGSSVGVKDFVPEVLGEVGELRFHGVNLRPGGPTAFGVVNGKPVFSLAGFPVASLVAFDMLVRPALRFMQGLPPDRGFLRVKAYLSSKVASTLGRVDIVRVKLSIQEKGLLAEPLRVTGSGILSSMTGADGFLIVPEDTEVLEKGDEVEVEVWDWNQNRNGVRTQLGE